MLCKSALVAMLATSFLLGEVPATCNQGSPTQSAVVPATGGAAPAEAVVVSEPGEPALAPAPTGGVIGRVTFKGKVPAAKPVELGSDPYCVGQHPDGVTDQRVLVGENGGLADVFVSLTGVPDERYKAPKEPVLIDQHGCQYTPHVFGIMKKQDLLIRNSDDTLHNIHAVPRRNKEFNVGMPTKGMEVTKKFKKDEDAILIKCDVHPWMSAHCFSMKHPYFGTTDAEGNVSIDASKLPDGEYGVRLWHETLGEKTAKVTVKGGAGRFEFSFE